MNSWLHHTESPVPASARGGSGPAGCGCGAVGGRGLLLHRTAEVRPILRGPVGRVQLQREDVCVREAQRLISDYTAFINIR